MENVLPARRISATTNIFYRNRGDGTFEDVSQHSGIGTIKGRSLGVSFADYDDDGFTDVFVANDGMRQFLFHNNGDGTFTECALEAGAALTDAGKPISGMGTVFQDYDNDGRPDILVTVLPREVYALFHNDGNGLFSYRSLQAGLGLLSAASSGWGVGLEDFNNDGWKDIFVAQSHVLDNVEAIDHMLHYKETPLLAFNKDGRFERGDSGVTMPIAGRGVAFGDLNNDGCARCRGQHSRRRTNGPDESAAAPATGSRSPCAAPTAIATALAPASRSTTRPASPPLPEATSPPATSACTSVWARRNQRKSKSTGPPAFIKFSKT